MDETRTLLLADDIRKIATSGMSGNGGENNEQAQGLFASRGRNNERSKGRGGKSRSKSRAHAERTCFKCEENRGSLVVMKGVRHRNLYPLMVETVTSDLAVEINRKDSKFVISRDVTFDEKSMVPNDGDVKILNQVIEIESEDQPDSSRGQVENPIASEDEEEDEHDHEEVQQENTHVLQQQQQESLETTRPKRNYKIVQKFGSDKPLRHYGQCKQNRKFIYLKSTKGITEDKHDTYCE
ncbi:hypothetical protein KIW84_054661 [Lathyrus oleraceus]|uniref:Uncharacterized protein n=1 Tax=Pisum sativum TaxID=3888 RepID=A0A9D4WVX8_PEA|nr:hypothetical protein KIW84_054661 [Pisum sativum]